MNQDYGHGSFRECQAAGICYWCGTPKQNPKSQMLCADCEVKAKRLPNAKTARGTSAQRRHPKR